MAAVRTLSTADLGQGKGRVRPSMSNTSENLADGSEPGCHMEPWVREAQVTGPGRPSAPLSPQAREEDLALVLSTVKSLGQ